MARWPLSAAPFPNTTIGLDINDAAIFEFDAHDVYVQVALYLGGSLDASFDADPHPDLWTLTVAGQDYHPTAVTADGHNQFHLTMPVAINAGDIIQCVMAERLGIMIVSSGIVYEAVIQHASTLVVTLE